MNFSNKRTRRSYRESIEQIRQAISGGANYAEEVASKVGLSPGSIVAYAQREGIRLPRKEPAVRLQQEPVIQLIRACVKSILERGVHDLDDIIQEAINGRSWSSRRIATQAEAMASEMGTVLTGGKNIYSARPRGEYVDSLVKQGRTQREIGEAMGGVLSEVARQYLHATGQYGIWAEAKRKLKHSKESEQHQLQAIRGGLVSLLRNRVYQVAQSEGWAAQKALEHVFTVNTPLQFTQIKDFFERYRDASSAGSKVSLAALVKDAGISNMTASRILRKEGLRPTYTNNNRLTDAEVAAIKRSERVPLSDPDVAYFVGVNEKTVIKRRSSRLNYFNYIKSSEFGHGRGCSFAAASQIYEAQDAGFTNEEIPQLLDFSLANVDNAIKQREWTEPEIVHALRKIYDNIDINKPYRNLESIQ